MAETCLECGLPYDGRRGDGIGSCDCPRCPTCGQVYGSEVSGLVGRACDDCWCFDCQFEDCRCWPEDDYEASALRPVVDVDTRGRT